MALIFGIILFILIFFLSRITKDSPDEIYSEPAPEPEKPVQQKNKSRQRPGQYGTDALTFVPTYVCMDVETTGLNRSKDKITQISLIQVQNDTVINSYLSYVNPGMHIPEVVTNLTGINDETVKDAPSFEQIKEKVSDFIGNRIIVGHNVDFDIEFLENALGHPVSNKRMDTLQFARYYFQSKDYKLLTLCQKFVVYLDNAHDAGADCAATVKLFEEMKKTLHRQCVTIPEDNTFIYQ